MPSHIPVRTRRLVLLTAALAAAGMMTVLSGGAGASVTPSSNVGTYGSPFCQANAYVRTVTIPRFTVHDAAGVCIEVPSPQQPGFRVSSNDGSRHWAYPNISAGFELNHSSCPTGTDMQTGLCLPVPEQIRYLDLTGSSVSWLSADMKGNLSWDLFFTPGEYSSSYSQMISGGTEVMIWQSHPGIGIGRTYAGNPVLHVRIGHRDWSVLWATTARHGWNYIAFVAPDTRTGTIAMRSLRFDPLLSYVIRRMHLLRDTWYYQAADFGMELYSGGAGSAVEQYSLLPPWLGRPSYRLAE